MVTDSLPVPVYERIISIPYVVFIGMYFSVKEVFLNFKKMDFFNRAIRLITLFVLFSSLDLTGKQCDSLMISRLAPVNKLYQKMVLNRSYAFSVTTFGKRTTRLSVAGNGINYEYISPVLSDSSFKSIVVQVGISYDSLILLIQMMVTFDYCSVGTADAMNIHIGYRYTNLTGRNYCYVFTLNDRGKAIADNNKSYIKISDGVYKYSCIER
ncbi:MAG: hypothetical protein IM638_06735 [Bacteroidetes bacterium]|nr:hypothetical protein [Bacteroidota bacterium]